MPSLWADSLDEHRRLVLDRLLDAYGELHAERGFEATTLSAVAERAGLARSAVYNHVADKHDLVVAYTERTLAGLAAEMVEAVGSAGSAADRLRVYVAWTLRSHAEVAGAGDDLMPVLSVEQQGRVLAALSPIRRLLEDTIAEGVATGEFAGDPSALGLLVWSALAGLRMPVAAGHLPPEPTATALADALLDGLRPRSRS